MRLADKIVLINGGTRGIGRAMVELFAREGGVVTFTGRGVETGQALTELVRAAGGQATYEELDALRLDQIERVIKGTAERHGRLDVLVNNFGISLNRTMLETTPEEFDAVYNLNVRSTYFATKYGAEVMVRQQFGSIINIASVAGSRGRPNRSVYGSGKAAVIQFSKTAALELAPYGVRVNCVSPGAIDTDLLRRARFAGLPNEEELVAEVGRKLPLGRIGYPRDVAHGALYLASDEAEWITGIDLEVAGGDSAR